MADQNIGVLEAIDIAIEAESKANKFYAEAVDKVSNKRGKDLLKQLANFEQKHYDILNDLKKSLLKSGDFIAYSGTTFNEVRGEFSGEIGGKIEENKQDVLDILTMAIDAESSAQQHYKKMADETTDEKGQEMFSKLADEELLHRRILSDEFFTISNKGGIWNWGD